MWTDEKHSIYLEHLEVSFVKQLHQSISLLEKCSDQDEGERSISRIDQINDAQVELNPNISFCQTLLMEHICNSSPD